MEIFTCYYIILHYFVAKCKKKNKLWEDPDFPASDESLYLQSGDKVTWKRPGVSLKNYSHFTTC